MTKPAKTAKIDLIQAKPKIESRFLSMKVENIISADLFPGSIDPNNYVTSTWEWNFSPKNVLAEAHIYGTMTEFSPIAGFSGIWFRIGVVSYTTREKPDGADSSQIPAVNKVQSPNDPQPWGVIVLTL